MEKRRMCPNCRAFITVNDRVCPYCEMNVGPRAVDTRPSSSFAASFLPSANVAAIVVLVVNFACFFVQLAISHNLSGPDPGIDYGQDFGLFVFHGQWWRLLSAGFFHASWLHLLMNSWSLFILVTEVEQFYGTNRMIVAYVFSTFTGFLAAAFMTPRTPVLGASCAAFGLMGIMLAMGVTGNRADPLRQLVRQHYGQWLVFGLLMSFRPGISMSGHVGGLIGGFLVGLIAGRPGNPKSARESFWRFAAIAAVAVVVIAGYFDFGNISYFLKHSNPAV